MKVNPSSIQAYRNMMQPARISSNPAERGAADRPQPGAKLKASGIESSQFIDLLSKAERDYLTEKFPARASAVSGGRAFEATSKGSFLDVKA